VKEMRKALFGMEILGDIGVEGWTDGTLWNGWAKPLFEFPEARKLLDAFADACEQQGRGGGAWYDERNDRFCFVLEGDLEPECFPSQIAEVAGREVKVYPIGAGAWIWEEVPG
jgi:hypothetical protein